MPPRLAHSHCYFRSQQYIPPLKVPSFSTSSTHHGQIPPESPRFIQAPRLVQPKQPFPIRLKGALPPPRKIFRRERQDSKRKGSPEYLAAVAPKSLVDRTIRTDDEFVSWKARQSELRRRNLIEGLTELKQRKEETDRKNAAKDYQNRRIREKLLYAPERKDAYLTNPSVLSSQRPARYRGLPDPERPARLAAKSQNVAHMAAMREEARRNSLHTLYVNAGDFIMTGEKLDAAIGKAFDDNSQFRSDNSEGVNIWNLGFPEKVEDLLRKSDKTWKRQTALDSAQGNEIITRDRMKKIGEELTGGKMLEEG